jgi:hypothetical protein
MQGVFIRTVGGVSQLKVFTTASGNQGQNVRVIVGVGKQFWLWNSIPNASKVISADFTDAPIVSTNDVENNASITGITVTPADVLTWGP